MIHPTKRSRQLKSRLPCDNLEYLLALIWYFCNNVRRWIRVNLFLVYISPYESAHCAGRGS